MALTLVPSSTSMVMKDYLRRKQMYLEDPALRTPTRPEPSGQTHESLYARVEDTLQELVEVELDTSPRATESGEKQFSPLAPDCWEFMDWLDQALSGSDEVI